MRSNRDRVLLRRLWLLLFLPLTHRAIADGPLPINTVFIILMENHDWTTIVGTTNCPYIKNTLLPMASHCEGYYNPPSLHPSEPNYIWLEAGTNFGILNDLPGNRVSSTNHLVTLLNNAGISWKSYQDDMGSDPLVDQNHYVVRHNPMVLFNDVNGNTAYMTSHVRPYTALAGDLQSNTVARYNFITPGLTNDMHDAACSSGCSGRVAGDYWLSHELPRILSSQAYSNNGAIFITWDEGSEVVPTSDGPIGMIVLSPLAKGHGYSNTNHYTHSSTLRTMQNVFGVRPYLGGAGSTNTTDLGDLFAVTSVPPIQLISVRLANATFGFTITNLVVGTTNYVQVSSNLSDWADLRTNLATSTSKAFSESKVTNFNHRFYRVKQVP